MTAEHPIDPQIGVRNPDAFTQRIRSYKGKPGNCMALVQLGMSNQAIFEAESSGERWINVLTFIKNAGGEQWIDNCTDFIKWHSPSLPQSARDNATPLTDEIFKHYWAWFDKLPK
jgi:hypothetical protein